MLARAWAALGLSKQLMPGVRWQGQGGLLLLFMLVSLPLLSARSVLAVADMCGVNRSRLFGILNWGKLVTQRRLSRFAASPRHDWLGVLAGMMRAMAHHEATAVGQEGIIAVDSTTVEKQYGPKLPEIRPVYDASKKRLVDGYELVSACAVGPKKAFPLGLLPHRKAPTASERETLKRRRRKAKEGEQPSKLDLALDLISRAIANGVGAATVVGDSAFAVMWWLREINALERHWLVATRQDRRLRIGAMVRTFRDLARDVPLELIETSVGGTTVYGARWPEVTLLDRHCQKKGLVCQAIYFERRSRQGKVIHRWYLVTDQMGWDMRAVWQHWQWRWKIEVMHREAKQHMHLADFHARTWEGIVAWIACSSLRASLLGFMRQIDPVCGARSMEALTAMLQKAACTVEPLSGEVDRPEGLEDSVLWQTGMDPLLAKWWPISIRAA